MGGRYRGQTARPAIIPNSVTTSVRARPGSSSRYTLSTLTASRSRSIHPANSPKGDVGDRLLHAHPCFVAGPGLGVDEHQVLPHPAHAVDVGDGTVPGHHDLGVQVVDDQVAGRDPVGDRARPHDRRPLDEADVAGEHGGGGRHVGDAVAGGVRRTDLEQLDRRAGDVDLPSAGEGRRRRGQGDALELEGPEDAGEVAAGVAELAALPGIDHGRQQRRRRVRHLLGARLGRHDLGVRHQLVPVAVVAVGVGVDHGGDGVAGGQVAEPVEHLPGQG
jgi:hypothetical protein